MAEILGLGVTHSPLLLGSDARMAGITERVLKSHRLPDRMRDPASWPAGMQAEWAEHQAGRATPVHRERALKGFQAARAALDAFDPDFVVIFGDDQYENFREDGVAPFCVFALDEVESRPFHRSGIANAWGEPADTVVRTKGHPAGGRYLAGALVEQGFDITWAYRMRHEHGLPWPVVPVPRELLRGRPRYPRKAPSPISREPAKKSPTRPVPPRRVVSVSAPPSLEPWPRRPGGSRRSPRRAGRIRS